MIDVNVIIPSLISAAVTLVVCILNARAESEKTRVLINYRLEQLEKKVDKHNQIVERMAIAEERLKVANHRISSLEEHVDDSQ